MAFSRFIPKQTQKNFNALKLQNENEISVACQIELRENLSFGNLLLDFDTLIKISPQSTSQISISIQLTETITKLQKS